MRLPESIKLTPDVRTVTMSEGSQSLRDGAVSESRVEQSDRTSCGVLESLCFLLGEWAEGDRVRVATNFGDDSSHTIVYRDTPEPISWFMYYERVYGGHSNKPRYVRSWMSNAYAGGKPQV